MLHIMYVKTIDPAEFRLPQDFDVKIKKFTPEHTTLGKPPNGEWFQIHPDKKGWRTTVATKKYNDEEYLVHPDVAQQQSDQVSKKVLVPCKTKQGIRHLWPVNLPKKNGWVDPYSKSAAGIEKDFSGKWIKIKTVSSGQYYEVTVYDGDETLEPPTWEDNEFSAMLGEAFGDRIISSADHPAFKKR